MKNKLYVIFFILLFSTQASAVKFSHKVGDVVENEVYYGKNIIFPLPPGKFTVALYKHWGEFKSVLLIQTDKNTGVIRWKIKLTATGSTDERNSQWLTSKICDQTDRYFIKRVKGKRFSCWLVSHSTTEPEDVVRQSISNNFFNFNQTILHKIKAEQSLLSKSKDYEMENNIISPSMFVVTKHHYGNKSKYYESEYYYNPELDGVPEAVKLDWNNNEFHKNKIRNFPKHEEFLKNFIGISAKLIDRFNELNKVKGKLTLNPQSDFVQTSAKVEKKSTNKKDIVNQIKGLKELLDAGVITQDEFDLAKNKILN
jgi:hypothetical protein